MTENAAARWRRTTKLSFHKQKGESFAPAANRKVHTHNSLKWVNRTKRFTWDK